MTANVSSSVESVLVMQDLTKVYSDWRRRQVRVDHGNNHYYRPPAIVNPTVVVDRGHWQREPRRREVQSPAQPPVRTLPVVERREHRHEVRQEQRAPAAPIQIQAAPRVQIQPQPQARMPAAVAPQQPRAHRHEAPRVEPRIEQRGGGRQRS